MDTILRENLERNFTISAADDVSSAEVQNNDHHRLEAKIDVDNGDINLNFSSRRAMYDFAKSLLQGAIYGDSGQQEFYPLISDGSPLVVNGVRMPSGSSRIFVLYPAE